MNPQSNLPRPLQPAKFYLLLALNRTAAHGYALKSSIRNMSLGSVIIPDSKIYKLIAALLDEAFIEPAGRLPTSMTGTLRMHYAITPHGTLRLKAELVRLNHAVKIAQSAGLMDDETPTDIQRLLLDLRP